MEAAHKVQEETGPGEARMKPHGKVGQKPSTNIGSHKHINMHNKAHKGTTIQRRIQSNIR